MLNVALDVDFLFYSFIQNEESLVDGVCVCDCDCAHAHIRNTGGSLYDAIVEKEAQGELFSEAELKELLHQVSLGLKYIHSSSLVHLDIKPSKSLLLVL